MNITQLNAQQLQRLYENLPKCFEMTGKHISSNDVIQALFYQMFGIWVGHIYEINKKHVYDECVASDRDYDFDDNYDVTKFHTFLLSEGFTTFMIDYDYYYINQWMIIHQKNDHVQLYCLDDVEQDNEFIKKIQDNLIVDTIEEDVIEVGILTHRNGTYFVSTEEFPRMNIDIYKTLKNDEKSADEIGKKMYDLINKCLYVCELQINKETIKKHDLSIIAPVMIVFDWVKKYSNDNWIACAGKDERTANMYKKVGKFWNITLDDKYSKKLNEYAKVWNEKYGDTKSKNRYSNDEVILDTLREHMKLVCILKK